jgi:hypothetical protein
MVSAVKTRPTYYELLGLPPRAAGNAIAAAFARATNVLQPHAFGSMAEICLAYETLRDPVRRRAYDASIGLKPEPLRMPASRPISAHFMAQPAVGETLAEPLIEPKPAHETKLDPKPAAEEKCETKPIAAVVEPPLQADFPSAPQLTYDEVNVGFGSIEWKRAGVVMGGLVAIAVLIGALAGWWSGSSAAEAQQPGAPVAARDQNEKKVPTFAELWSGPGAQNVEGQPDRSRRAVVTRSRAQRPSERTGLAAPEAESELIQPPAGLADPLPSDTLAPEPAVAPIGTANMPLPRQTVARTIDRIGYNCGRVASATPVDGAAGVYRVNCSSGQSFQAKPVNGRYRFRRLARN